ncbi:MAG: hypothetical protein ACREMZ_05345 [Gemmatimonadales bacterium]
MLTPVRGLALACLLLLPARAAADPASIVADTSGLQFHGFRAGARLNEIDAHLRRLNGGRMRCQRSRIDPRVTECRAMLNDQELGGSLSLWISAIDSVAGVIMLSGVLTPERLEGWRLGLEERYGRVGTRVQGTQRMLQWVRRGRMLRLTWRLEGGEKVASVSLVDGHVLDRWGKTQAPPASRAS